MALFGAAASPAKPKPEIDIGALRDEIKRLKEESEITRKYGTGLSPLQMDFYRKQLAHEKLVAEKRARNAILEEAERERIAKETEETFRALLTASFIVVHCGNRRAEFDPSGHVKCPECGNALQGSTDILRTMAPAVCGMLDNPYKIMGLYPQNQFILGHCKSCNRHHPVTVQVVPGL